MGEAYRARDTRLERTFAIKILPSELSSNSSLKQRFERELQPGKSGYGQSAVRIWTLLPEESRANPYFAVVFCAGRKFSQVKNSTG